MKESQRNRTVDSLVNLTIDLKAELREIVEWARKVGDKEDEGGSSAGENYLNGDSNKYPGNAWSDLNEIIKRAKRLLRDVYDRGMSKK